MWTPKRVLLLVLGVVIFTAAYGVYAHFLGRVDGLPPLPVAYEAAVKTEGDVAVPENTPIEVDRKLQMAFGQNCPEVSRAIRLDIRARGVVLACEQFTVIDKGPRQGQVQLMPFSIAIFGKDKGDGHYPEINTVRSDIAYLTFDQPITQASEMGNRKIVGGELSCQVVQDSANERERRGEGGVRIVNNRSTQQRDDDLTLFTPGPVFFQESLHQIWTREPVLITDEQTKPKPTTVNAIGMDVYLTTEDESKPTAAAAPVQPAAAGKHAGKAAARKKGNGNSPSITGVKAVVLRADVAMHLWVDAKSGFLGSNNNNAPKKPAKDLVGPPAPTPAAPSATASTATPEKAQVVIKTQGPFVYDVLTDHARYDISQHPGPHPNNVEVSRRHEPEGAWDQLICDHLELQFARKPSAKDAPAPAKQPAKTTEKKANADEDKGVDLQIETAHAWGTQVTITSDTEGLTALGNDLVYNARTRESTLVGSPDMVAMKDGHEIVAKKLVLIGSADDKEGQQARAQGPGRINLLNKESGSRPIQARWNNMLVSVKDGAYDMLTLTGDAVFEDKANAQFLQADQIKVWLEPGDSSPPPQPKTEATAATPAQKGDETQKRRPHHVEAVGKVLAKSPEMNVHDTDRLVIWFKDAARPDALPGPQPEAAAANNGQPGEPAKPAGTAPAAGSTPAGPPKPSAPAKAQADEPPKRPIDLRARAVEAHVLRATEKNDLEKLWCEGNVHVHQEPTNPQERGTNITGETMQILAFPEGHVLTVTGELAEVQLDKLTILGPEVNIDQKENKAWVNGLGCMKMPSDKTFNGDALEKPVELTVHWNRDMFFNGRYALFHGGIQAEQENSRLACQTLQVFLDRFVSLKETEKAASTAQGQKPDAPAKVQKLVCDKDVRIEDCKREEGKARGKVVSYQCIEAPILSLDNEENVVTAPGPGIVRLLQLGPKDDSTTGPTGMPMQPAGAPKPPGATPPPEEMKLTRINYLGRMFGNNTTRTAVFYDSVEVVHVPTENPNLVIDVDKPLPQGAMYLRCNQLKVYSRKVPGTQTQNQNTGKPEEKTNQELEAHGKAMVQAQEFWGRADVIKYDESKELVVFESAEGNLATLYRVKVRGGQAEEIRGKKIFYWRRTNDFKIEGGTNITAGGR